MSSQRAAANSKLAASNTSFPLRPSCMTRLGGEVPHIIPQGLRLLRKDVRPFAASSRIARYSLLPANDSSQPILCFDSTYDFLLRWEGRALRRDTFGTVESANVDIQTSNVSSERIAMHT